MVLDCAAGMGTLALTLAANGYTVEGSDLAEASIERAQREATAKALPASFRIDDIRKLEKAPLNHYGAVLALENVIPHLATEECMRATLKEMIARLRPGGVLVVGIRDYEKLIAERPSVMAPTFHGEDASRRIVHEVWDWHDDRCYTFHLYITRQRDQRWDVLHFTGTYRAITAAELSQMMTDVGCEAVEMLSPEQSGFHQPIVVGRRKAEPALAAAETPAVVAEPATEPEPAPAVAAETTPAVEVPAPEPPDSAEPAQIEHAAAEPEPSVPEELQKTEVHSEPEIAAAEEKSSPEQPAPSFEDVTVVVEPPVAAPGIELSPEFVVTPFEYPEPVPVPETMHDGDHRLPAALSELPVHNPEIAAQATGASEPVREDLTPAGAFVQIENETVRIDSISKDTGTSAEKDAAAPMEIAEALARLEPVALEEEGSKESETVLSSSRPRRFVL